MIASKFHRLKHALESDRKECLSMLNALNIDASADEQTAGLAAYWQRRLALINATILVFESKSIEADLGNCA